jgi:hypothetical protein
MHHPAFSVSLHGGSRDVRERWTPLFERYRVSAVFSGHDHVYERAEHDGIRYFVTGGGGAPLYARRTRPNPLDEAAVQRFERAVHYLRVVVAHDQIEVTAVRADGTAIETQTWIEPQAIAAAGAPAAPRPLAPAAPRPPDEAVEHSVVWPVLAGFGLLLASLVVVARTLRAGR